MRKITFILMALVIGFTSCSDDDDDAPETCAEYTARYEKKFEALDELDVDGFLALMGEMLTNLPEGCEEEIVIE